jgi:hypothetical protein
VGTRIRSRRGRGSRSPRANAGGSHRAPRAGASRPCATFSNARGLGSLVSGSRKVQRDKSRAGMRSGVPNMRWRWPRRGIDPAAAPLVRVRRETPPRPTCPRRHSPRQDSRSRNFPAPNVKFCAGAVERFDRTELLRRRALR